MLAAKINGILQHTEEVVKEIAGNGVYVRVDIYVKEQVENSKFGKPFSEERAKVIQETLEFNGLETTDEKQILDQRKVMHKNGQFAMEFIYAPDIKTQKQQLEQKKKELEELLAVIYAEEEKQNKEFNDAMDAAAYGHYMINDVEVAGDGTESA